ncbi:unnamed protein product [Adineta ricciae]|uniref:Uncharacterized protein n=2 Tax=Adineta ricciae TaxID=249248 RepID=A0A814B070_ADIRI|nr:unnamed protein product [Adineta ricciae]
MNRSISNEDNDFEEISVVKNYPARFPTISPKNDQKLSNTEKNNDWLAEIQKFLKRISPHFQTKSICSNYWAVTVNMSDGVLKTAKQLPNWCIVVVVSHSPKHHMKISENIFILNKTIQSELAKISLFYKESLSLSDHLHTAQKNLGYLWAIYHNAKIIWDFDNIEEMLVNETILELLLNDQIESLTIPNHNGTFFNPHQYFISKPNFLFPTLHGVWSSQNLGVIHSLDETSLQSKKMSRNDKNHVKLIAPRRTFSPYDQQATLHLQSALWALLLPVTIDQKRSHLFRSYVMQRLMWEVGLQTAFVDSYVVKKNRNHQNRIERNLSQFLKEWSSKERNFIEFMKQLFISLSEHHFIEIFDLRLVQLWLEELNQIGYQFPKIPHKYSLVIRTFSSHLTQLNRWYLLTINMFVDRNVFDILFILDNESTKDHQLGDCLTKHNYSVKYESPFLFDNNQSTLPGYDRQQWSTFYMDRFTNSDYIGVIDADAMIFTFMHPIFSIFTSKDDRRIVLKAIIGENYHQDKMILQFNSTLDFMWTNRMPMWYRYETFQNLRNYITSVWNETHFDNVFLKFYENQSYSQFNILSNYANRFESNYYRVILNTDSQGAVSVASNRGWYIDIFVGCCQTFNVECNKTLGLKRSEEHLLRFDNSDFLVVNASEKTKRYYTHVYKYLEHLPSHVVSKMKQNCQLFVKKQRAQICTS